MPGRFKDWKTLDDAKRRCKLSCKGFYDICGNERYFSACMADSIIVDEPHSLVCGPTVEKATILYNRGTFLILTTIVSLIKKTLNKVIYYLQF